MNITVNVSLIMYFGLYLLETHSKIFMMAEICLKTVSEGGWGMDGRTGYGFIAVGAR